MTPIRMNHKTSVGVVGLGIVGLPTAIYAARFFDVTGFDISDNAIRAAAARGLKVSDRIAQDIGVYLVLVRTWMHSDGTPDVRSVYDVCEKIAESSKDPLVCIESTVPVGTTRDIEKQFGLTRVVHCPHRYWEKDPIRHGVAQPRVLGAKNKSALDLARRFYSKLKIRTHLVSSPEAAELSKIAEQAYRYVQIAFAEDLRMTCGLKGLSFEEVRAACNSKWNIEILEARQGIAGHCLPKDVRYLWTLRRSALLSGAIQEDRNYRKHLRKNDRNRSKAGT
jgi:nucleotide sugar dehydrogenase